MLAQRKALVDKWRAWKISNPIDCRQSVQTASGTRKSVGSLYYFGPLDDPHRRPVSGGWLKRTIRSID